MPEARACYNIFCPLPPRHVVLKLDACPRIPGPPQLATVLARNPLALYLTDGDQFLAIRSIEQAWEKVLHVCHVIDESGGRFTRPRRTISNSARALPLSASTINFTVSVKNGGREAGKGE